MCFYRVFLLLLLSLTLGGCHLIGGDQHNWQLLHDEGNMVMFYADTRSIRENPEDPQIKLVQTLVQGELIEMQVEGTASVMALMMIDCKNKTEHEVSTRYYSRAWGNGELIDEHATEAATMKPMDNFISKKLFKLVCLAEAE